MQNYIVVESYCIKNNKRKANRCEDNCFIETMFLKLDKYRKNNYRIMLNQISIIIKTINLFNTFYRVVNHFIKVISMITEFIVGIFKYEFFLPFSIVIY